MELKFYKCDKCGNILTFEKNPGCPAKCCGELMRELVPGTTDGAKEKHVPVCEVEGNKVTVCVGSVAHPMTEAHLIEFIYLVTKNGYVMKKALTPEDEPKAVFTLNDGDEVETVYEYCNLHGLWKA